MASRMRCVCQGRLGPFVPSMPLSPFPGERCFNLSPIEFRQVMACLRAEAIFPHPQSFLKNPYRLKPAFQSVFVAHLWGIDVTSKTALTAQRQLKFCRAARLGCEQSLRLRAPKMEVPDPRESKWLAYTYCFENRYHCQEIQSAASRQAFSQDFFPPTASWPDFTEKDLCRIQTVRRFSDRSAKSLQASSIVFMSVCKGIEKKPRGPSVKGEISMHAQVDSSSASILWPILII